MSWTNKYQGIPFSVGGRDASGLDCWGLVRRVYLEELDIELPIYSGYSDTKDSYTTEKYKVETGGDAWKEINTPQVFDVLVFRVQHGFHLAINVSYDMMLHTVIGREVCIESFKHVYWRNKLIGIFRHKGIMK